MHQLIIKMDISKHLWLKALEGESGNSITVAKLLAPIGKAACEDSLSDAGKGGWRTPRQTDIWRKREPTTCWFPVAR